MKYGTTIDGEDDGKSDRETGRDVDRKQGGKTKRESANEDEIDTDGDETKERQTQLLYTYPLLMK